MPNLTVLCIFLELLHLARDVAFFFAHSGPFFLIWAKKSQNGKCFENEAKSEESPQTQAEALKSPSLTAF